MGNTTNNAGIVGVPQILITAQRCIAPDSLSSHTERCDPTPKQFMTKMNETCNFNKVWEQKSEDSLGCIGCAF